VIIHFRYERLIADRAMRWTATIPCTRCGKTVTVTRGEMNAVLRVDREFLGIVCPSCLAPHSRAELAARRGEQEVPR
jgi:hypothetical protein